jgi:hypothetical protein
MRKSEARHVKLFLYDIMVKYTPTILLALGYITHLEPAFREETTEGYGRGDTTLARASAMSFPLAPEEIALDGTNASLHDALLSSPPSVG